MFYAHLFHLCHELGIRTYGPEGVFKNGHDIRGSSPGNADAAVDTGGHVDALLDEGGSVGKQSEPFFGTQTQDDDIFVVGHQIVGIGE